MGSLLMAQQLQPNTLSSPGFFGMNSQDSPVVMDQSFALKAQNCVIDKSGRIAARKGWSKVNTTNTELSTSNISCLGELVANDGSTTTLAAGGAYLFKLVGNTLTTLTYGGGGVAPVITASNWQFVHLNGVAIFWQIGHDPLIYEPAVSTSTFRRLSERSGYAGTSGQCNTALSAFGRIWAADTLTDKNTVVFSDLLAPHIYTGGTSGTLNVSKVWTNGADEIVALAAHNNFLIIFGKFQMIVYTGASDPATMTVQDTIVGVGCLARDSVQNLGTDVWFLSSEGVQSFGRVIQEKSSPINEITKNIRDEIIEHIQAETLANIKSVYSNVDSFYLITLPTAAEVYCIDTKTPLTNGGYRVTAWNGNVPTALCSKVDNTLIFGKSGYVGLYGTYNDDVAAYRMVYHSPYIDFGNPIFGTILKKIQVTTIGVCNSAIMKWSFDFIWKYFSFGFSIKQGSGVVAYYGEDDKYNTTAEYTTPVVATTTSINASGSGTVAKFGFEAVIDGNPLSLQKIDILTKQGKLR